MQPNPIVVIVRIADCDVILRKDFFSSNSEEKTSTCKKCKKSKLGRYQRVDCEFWPDDVETYCIPCWVEEYNK